MHAHRSPGALQRARGFAARGGAGLGALPWWPIAVFALGAVVLLTAARQLIARLGLTGDEPWYLLQAVALLRFHTPDLAHVIHSPLYTQLLGTQRDDHTRDYLGNGERMLVNLPGYAALIAPAYALGGRMLVGMFQALAAALTGVLVFDSARRIFGSRLVAICAWLAYLVPLPVLLYAGQLFPSTLAACAMMLGYVLVTVQLPRARGWRLVLAGLALGAVVGLLPWLHVKYALAALALAGMGAAALWPRLATGLGPRPRGVPAPLAVARGGESAQRPTVRPLTRATAATPATRPALAATDRATEQRWARAALAASCAPLALSLGLIALYSRTYFGTWTPPNSLRQPDWLHPQLGAVAALYADMFVGRQSGLLPWVPLALLVVPGAVLLWRRAPVQGRALVLLLVAQLAAFVTAAVSPVFQGKALPARFTVESLPLCALCVAAVGALGLPALDAALRGVSRWIGPDGPRWLRWIVHQRAPSGPGAEYPAVAISRRALAIRTLVALTTGMLLLATAWFAIVGQRDPALLYPSPAGPRLVAEYPAALPGAWFALFPTVLPAQWVVRGELALAPASAGALAGHDAQGAATLVGMPGRLPAGAPLAASGSLLAPAGAYVAMLTVACALPAGGARSADGSAAQLSVRSPWQRTRPVVAQRPIAVADCRGAQQPLHVTLRFVSDGYRPLTFLVTFAGATTVVVWNVAYAPA